MPKRQVVTLFACVVLLILPVAAQSRTDDSLPRLRAPTSRHPICRRP